VIFLTAEEMLFVARRAIGAEVVVRDLGLLESAAARPQASAFGRDAYPSLAERAAALVHSLVNNRALVDGNKRLGLAGLIAFLGVNGYRLTWTNDETYGFIVDVADGTLVEVGEISIRIGFAAESASGVGSLARR
jgi:death on curing protein